MTRKCKDCSNALPADCGPTRKFCDKCNRRRKAEGSRLLRVQRREETNQRVARRVRYGEIDRGVWGSEDCIAAMAALAEEQGRTTEFLRGVDGEPDPEFTISGTARRMMR